MLDAFADAACVGSPLPFTTEDATPDGLRAAVQLCAGCPAVLTCRAWAEQQPHFDGVAAGRVWRRGRIVGAPTEPRPVLVDQVSLRRWHSRFNAGHRDPDTAAGERAYQAAKYRALQARARAAAAAP